MPLNRPSKPVEEDEEPEEREHFWRGLIRDLIIAAIIVVVILAAMYAYTGLWPPLVVVESGSMQHSNSESFIGVIDTGDMVFQQAAPTRSSVVTYIEGRASGYSTYGDYGDVIIFNRAGNPTPVIHRAIMFISLHANGTADVPDLGLLTGWQATNAAGQPTTTPYFLRSVTIHNMGFQHDLGITFVFCGGPSPPACQSGFAGFGPRDAYVTMGDNNAYLYCSLQHDPCQASTPYDTGWLPRQGDIIGRARGEIPWFGLLKLTLAPTESCCTSWGSPDAPKNSWDSLLVSLIFLLALPLILEYAGRGWTKYIAPRLPEIPWPWKRRSRADRFDPPDRDDRPRRREKKPPKEESFEL